MVLSPFKNFSHMLVSGEYAVASWSSSPFCLWIGFELFIVCHSEEYKLCLIGCEKRKGVQIKNSAGTDLFVFIHFCAHEEI